MAQHQIILTKYLSILSSANLLDEGRANYHCPLLPTPSSSLFSCIGFTSMSTQSLQPGLQLSGFIPGKRFFSKPIYRSSPPTPRPPIRTYVAGQPRGPATEPLKAWPFIFIFIAGSATYVLMVKSRVNTNESSKPRAPSVTPK